MIAGTVNTDDEKYLKKCKTQYKQDYLQVEPHPTNDIEVNDCRRRTILTTTYEKIKQLRAKWC